MRLGSLRICQKIYIFVTWRILLLSGVKRVDFGLIVNKSPTVLHLRVRQLPNQLDRQYFIGRTSLNVLLGLLLVLRALILVGFPLRVGLHVNYILDLSHKAIVFWMLIDNLRMSHLPSF